MSVPEHVAIIMDGNGRWATARGLPRAAGHRSGARRARAIVEIARKSGVKVLTLFAFSSENWQRPRAEVRMLMDLFRRTIRREIDALEENNVRLSFIGARRHFSRNMQELMADAERRTRDNDGLDMIVAVDYGGRWDMIEAVRALAADCAAGTLSSEDIDETRFAECMSLSRFPEPDLFIRTGGECRISNFLLWHLAYSELYFTETLWPDFDDAAFRGAIEWYACRERRFGRLPPVAAPGG